MSLGGFPADPERMTAAHPAVELDTAASLWERALDSAQFAVRDAGGRHGVAGEVLQRHQHELVQERCEVAEQLVSLGRMLGARARPWLSPVPLTPAMLGLAPGSAGCVFDLDGVLTDAAVLHATAWAEVFDSFLGELAHGTERSFARFDPVDDYAAYVDGRPRLEGINAFLESRGLRVPEGDRDDPPDAQTAYGLAQRKADTLAQGLRLRGVAALPLARRYLEAAGHLGLVRCVVSASTSARPMLELADLAILVEACVDGETMRSERLVARPAPDVLLAACGRLDLEPDRVVTFTHSPDGVAAGIAAGVEVIAVAEGAHAETLRRCGAERVVPSVASLLDRQLVSL
jgi:beta-phosphoglucomutase-like phosphatase (HAD superfamily)